MTVQSYFQPRSVEEACSLLTKYGEDILVIAGGTLAMPLINSGISSPQYVLGLKHAGLDFYQESNGYYVIGATATMTQMVLQKFLPMLREAALAVGGWAVRNMGTVGGNLFAPPPGGDFAAAALAVDAELVVADSAGKRTIPLNEFFTGFMLNSLQPDEMVTEIRISKPEGRTAFLKYGRRHANTPSIVTVAVNLILDGEEVQSARIALNAVGPFPFRAQKAEDFLVGKMLNEQNISQAAELAGEESRPFTDPIASEWYRRKMVPVITKRALQRAAS